MKALLKSLAVLLWFALVFPLFWDDKQQVKDDLRQIADWWVK